MQMTTVEKVTSKITRSTYYTPQYTPSETWTYTMNSYHSFPRAAEFARFRGISTLHGILLNLLLAGACFYFPNQIKVCKAV